MFDVLDLRFEAATDSNVAVSLDEKAITMHVVDVEGKPVEGATVIVDAERSNWARSALTDKSGSASVQPYVTKTRRHMIRVIKQGMVPVEVRDLPGTPGPIRVVLSEAATFRGTVTDPAGKPLANAIVSIKVRYRSYSRLWTVKDAQVLTDERGYWQSPPLPAGATKVMIQLSHTEYTQGPQYSATYSLPVDELQAGDVVLPIKPQDNQKEQRRPGYDPFKIFRRLSRLGHGGNITNS